MFRKIVCRLFPVLLCFMFFSGCTRKTEPVDIKQIQSDIDGSKYWQYYDAPLITCSITKRQTNPENKTDFVFVHAIGANALYRIDAYYKLTYVLYNEGWLLEDLIPDPKNEPVITSIQHFTAEPLNDSHPANDHTEESDLDEWNAQLVESVENGETLICITCVIPANATITIVFPEQTNYTWTNNENTSKTRKVKIPIEVFYPSESQTQKTIDYTPEIIVTRADGDSYHVNCPSFTITFP